MRIVGTTAAVMLLAATMAGAQAVGSIAGTVRTGTTPTADVRILLDKTRELRSDSLGRFRFDSVSVGQHRVEALSLGTAPSSHDVGVIADYVTRLDIALERVVVLDSVFVEGNSVRLGYVRGYEARKKLGLGKFLDSTRVRSFGEFHQAMSFVTGLRIVTDPRTRQSTILFRTPGFLCGPDIWIDGTNWGDEQGALRTMRTDDVMAVEIYNSLALIPEQFYNPRARCGALVVWTRRLWPQGRKP